jgi:hypothetical protein
VTDEDCALVLELSRLNKECGKFCAGVIENALSCNNHLILDIRLADMSERIRGRALKTPVVIEGEVI